MFIIFIYTRNFSQAKHLNKTGFSSIFLAAKFLFKGLSSGSPLYLSPANSINAFLQIIKRYPNLYLVPRSNYPKLPQSPVAYLLAPDSMTSNLDIWAQMWLVIPHGLISVSEVGAGCLQRLTQDPSHRVCTLKVER